MPLPEKWQMDPSRLSPGLEIVLGGGRCHGTPTWTHLLVPTYWHCWQSKCSHSLFTATKETKKVEAKCLREVLARVPIHGYWSYLQK